MHSEWLERVGQIVLADWPIEKWRDTDLIVAVSGGPDSVALFRIVQHIKQHFGGKGRVIVAHCNHHTRSQSEADADFVRVLAEQHGVEYLRFDRDCSARDKPSGAAVDASCASASEETLREFRLKSLLTAANERGARYVLTGHTADDQIETILFRLFRGTGLAGLAGIPFARVVQGISIVRPLLRVHRREIVNLLEEIRQPWRIDESNLDSAYTRNFLRNEIIPRLTDRFIGQFESSILGLASQAQNQNALMDRLTEFIFDSATITVFDQVIVECQLLQTLPEALVRHALKRIWAAAKFPMQAMSRDKWQQLADLVASDSRMATQFPGRISVTIDEGKLRIERNPADSTCRPD